MPCNVYRSDDGEITAIVCSRGRQSRKLCSCGRPATLLCDWPLAGPKAGKTCDRPICTRCASHVGPDRDYCQAHARLHQEASNATAE